MSSQISSDKQVLYHQILYPTQKSSYNSKFFLECGYKFSDITKTYSGTEKKVVKIFKVFAILFAMLLVNLVKLVVAVTIITPLVFTFVNLYQNRNITAGNKDLNRKAIALVKASEEHLSLGHVTTALEELSSQSQVIQIKGHTNPQALKNTVHNCHDKATLHHNLIVTARAWKDVVESRLLRSSFYEDNNRVSSQFDKNEFIEYAVKTLSYQGHPEIMNMNAVNARIALTDGLIVRTDVRSMEQKAPQETTPGATLETTPGAGAPQGETPGATKEFRKETTV